MEPESTTARIILRVLIQGNVNVTDLAATMTGTVIALGHRCDDPTHNATVRILEAIPVTDVADLGPLATIASAMLDQGGGIVGLGELTGPGGGGDTGEGDPTGDGYPGRAGG